MSAPAFTCLQGNFLEEFHVAGRRRGADLLTRTIYEFTDDEHD